MEIFKGTTSHYGIRNIADLKSGDPVFATINGLPLYCQVDRYNEVNQSVTLKTGQNTIGEVYGNGVFDIYIDSRHFQQMGFEYGCFNDVCFFSLRQEPSFKFVPNNKDSVAMLANQLILVTDLEKWKEDIAKMDGNDILDEYPTVGSLRFLMEIYNGSNSYGEIESKIIGLLNHLNSL